LRRVSLFLQELFARAQFRSHSPPSNLHDGRIGLVPPLLLAVLAHRMTMRRLRSIWQQLFDLGCPRGIRVLDCSGFVSYFFLTFLFGPVVD
jgi:hypothetical protein